MLRSLITAALALLVVVTACKAKEPWKDFHERFSLDMRILAYGTLQEPASSTQNPSNDFLQIPRYVSELEARPDLRLDMSPLVLSAKPRARLEYEAWGEGERRGDPEWEGELFINEWLTSWRVVEGLFVSYGRENLQWGPSLLLSPSNPFFKENGRRNPYLEVPGMDFGRIVWIPNRTFALSFIANTDEGRSESNEALTFKPTYALKADYTGSSRYGSLILSHKEGNQFTLGAFGGWTVSESVLLYAEGAVSEGGEDALYPVEDRSPFGASMERGRREDRLTPAFLAGASCTFQAGGSLTLEYVYYGPGYSDGEAGLYDALRSKAAESITSGGFLSGLGKGTLGKTVRTGLVLERRNYALLQLEHHSIGNGIDLVLRWVQNLDDGSGQFTPVFSYPFADHFELFSVGTVTTGGSRTEFRSILDYQWMIGIVYTW